MSDARRLRAARLAALALALAVGAPPSPARASEEGSAPLLEAEDLAPLRGTGAVARGSDARGAWLRFETAGPGATAAVGTPTPLGAPLDLRGRFVSLRVRVDGTTRLAGAELVLASREGAFLIAVPVFADEPMNLLQSGGWIDLTLGLGAARREGWPDRAAIERVEWRVAERADPGPRVTGFVGALRAHALPAEGVVSLTFDDGYDEHYAVAAPLLAERGMRATAYAMPEQVGQQGYMTLEQLHALRRNFGWDVAAHHFTPFTELPERDLPGILDGLQRYLAGNGFDGGRRHLAYPLGKHDARILALVRPRFATARLASGGAETLPPADPHRLRALNVLDSTPPEALVAAARRAREEREWLILMFHFLVDAPQRETEYRIASLRQAIAGIADTGVAVRPVSEVWP
jgi:peptidoglycan/xylan/chitin deacetylase (PgdA/CDA1 family)